MSWRRSATYPAASTAPASSRDFCARTLLDMLVEYDAVDCLDDVVASAQVIVSELVTNAVNARSDRTEVILAAAGGFGGCVAGARPTAGRVRIEVSDEGYGTPVLRAPNTTDTHGRGLQIVAALSVAWGVEPRAHGTRVWAELPVTRLVA